jgi:hypothetical protein
MENFSILAYRVQALVEDCFGGNLRPAAPGMGGHYDAQHKWVSTNQTANFGGERFGYEQVDLSKGWLKKYESLKRGS